MEALLQIIYDSSFQISSQFSENGCEHRVPSILILMEELGVLEYDENDELSSASIQKAVLLATKDWFDVEAFRWLFETFAAAIRIHLNEDFLMVPTLIIRLHGVINEGQDDDCRTLASIFNAEEKQYIDFFRQLDSHVCPDGQFPDVSVLKGKPIKVLKKQQTLVFSLPSKINFSKEIAKKVYNHSQLRVLRDFVLERLGIQL